eukprot:m.31857 g.31857  ORF g.31857 m.31857 type:complete len:1451 (+) comp8355_c0_seq1:121-4473(+)
MLPCIAAMLRLKLCSWPETGDGLQHSANIPVIGGDFPREAANVQAARFVGSYFHDGRKALLWRCDGCNLSIRYFALEEEVPLHTKNYRFDTPVANNGISGQLDNGQITLNVLFSAGYLARIKIDSVDGQDINFSLESSHEMVTFSPVAVSGCRSSFTVANDLEGSLSNFHWNEEEECMEGRELLSKPLMSRILTGLTPNFMRPSLSEQRALCTCTTMHNDAIIVFALCADVGIRILKRIDKLNKTVLEHVISLAQFIDITEFNSKRDSHVICCPDPQVAGLLTVIVYVAMDTEDMVFKFNARVGDDLEISVTTVMTIPCPFRAISVCLTPSYIWALTHDNSDTKVVYTEVDSSQNPSALGWRLAFEGEPSPKNINFSVPNNLSPRTAYCDFIFESGRFSKEVLVRALRLYADDHSVTDYDNSTICKAVEDRIRDNMNMYNEIDYKQYRDVEDQQWRDFLDVCIEEWIECNTPVGLCADNYTQTVLLVTQGSVEIIQAASPLETLCTAPSSINVDNAWKLAASQKPVKGESILGSDIAAMMRALLIMQDCLESDSEVSRAFLEDPVAYSKFKATDMTDRLEYITSKFGLEITAVLRGVKSMTSAVNVILNCLDPRTTPFLNPETNPDEMQEGEGMNGELYYCSTLGKHLLASSVRANIRYRFGAARNLLYVISLVCQLGQRIGVRGEEIIKLASLRARVVDILKLVSPLKWACTRYFGQFDYDGSHSEDMTLMDAYVHNEEVEKMSPRGNEGTINEILALRCDLTTVLVQHALEVSSASSPQQHDCIAGNVFAMFLLRSRCFDVIHEYVATTNGTSGHLEFISGLAYLHEGQYRHAKTSFLNAATFLSDLVQLDFLSEGIKCLGSTDANSDLAFNDENLATINVAEYYLLVMHIFEKEIPRQLNSRPEKEKPSAYRALMAPSIVMECAFLALNFPSTDGEGLNAEQKRKAWAIIFRTALQLADYDKAFMAITASNEVARDAQNWELREIQKDQLQRLIGVLCDRREMQVLVEYNYGCMEADACEALTTRAKHASVDVILSGNSINYFEALYSFHLKRGNYRKAAYNMLRYAHCLKKSISSLKQSEPAEAVSRLLKESVRAYQVAENALRIVPDQHDQWLTMPGMNPGNLKRKREQGQQLDAQNAETPMDLVTVEDLKRDGLLLRGQLALHELEMENLTENLINTASLTTSDTTAIVDRLSVAGLFDLAFNISQTFANTIEEDTVKGVFLELTNRCVHIQVDPSHPKSNWDWLETHDLNPLVGGGSDEYDSEDPLWVHPSLFFSAEKNTASKSAWHLLQFYLWRYDRGPENNYQYHTTVADHILSLRVNGDPVPLPRWLVLSFKKRRPAALLKLFGSYDLWDAAVKFAISVLTDYHQAGRHSEQRTLSSVKTTCGINWLPHRELQQIFDVIDIRKATADDEQIAAFNLLQELYKKYLKESEKLSNALDSKNI